MMVKKENEITSTITPFQLLNLARECEKAGIFGFASDLYSEIVNKYPDTSEAIESNIALQSIAGRYAAEGKMNLSVSLLEKINLVCRLSLIQDR